MPRGRVTSFAFDVQGFNHYRHQPLILKTTRERIFSVTRRAARDKVIPLIATTFVVLVVAT